MSHVYNDSNFTCSDADLTYDGTATYKVTASEGFGLESTGESTAEECHKYAYYNYRVRMDFTELIASRYNHEDEPEFFASTMNKVIFEISLNPERQMWYDWEDGDLLIVDPFRMAHGVRGGYEPGQRNFQGYWLHESGTPAEQNPRFTSLPAKV